MEVILPHELHNEQKFLDCATQIRYDEFSAKKFVYFNSRSDVDVYECMGDYRLQTLLYGWEVCSLHLREAITEEMCHIVKVLAHYSLQLWFSQEWRVCSSCLKDMLLYYLKKSAPAFAKIDVLCEIDWPYLLNFQSTPWRLPYLQQLFAHLKLNKRTAIEHPVPAATEEDVIFLQQERLHLILLRLVKLFDSGSWTAVKQLSLRVLAAWLKCNANASLESLQRDQASIILVAHLHLMSVFVADDNRGYVIDNMIYNIRFYTQSMQEAPGLGEITYTPARLIAQICVLQRLGKCGFFEQIVFKKFNLSLVTSFAVILEAYTSYLLGNQLLELMALNEHDFMTHLSQFKVLMHRYVEEREKSERFLLNELAKLDAQRNSHAMTYTVQLNLNYQQQICKGNRASNIGNYKNCDDDDAEKPLDFDEERDRQIDTVFQNVPDNYEVLEFVYHVLAQRSYNGWQFAKIVLLLKIIGHKLNTIETWRYHPGLTTRFMLNLEQKLAHNYADLAKVFSENAFMEAEFWLTAFYLHPTRAYYGEVKRCSRIKRKRGKEEDELPTGRPAIRGERPLNIKFELLSSTIDVDEIVQMTNHSAPTTDYEPIYQALQALRLPRSVTKDLLTVVFQPRNKRYSWALDWNTLHERCSALLNSVDLKRKFVALNMAEANDHLKFLKIDYAKYKNRPQLDYGSIEEGYEYAASMAEAEVELSADEDDEPEVRIKTVQEKKPRRNVRKYWDEVVSEEEDEGAMEASDDSDEYTTSTGRRTRVRAAAVVANAMISDMDRSMRFGRRSPNITEMSAPALPPVSVPVPELEPEPEPEPENSKALAQESSVEKRPFGQLLEAREKYNNETIGFKAFTDIWSFDKEELMGVENDDKVLLESSSVLSKFKSLKCLKRKASAVLPGDAALPDEQKLGFIEPVRSRRRLDNEKATDRLQSEAVAEAVLKVSKGLTPPPALSALEAASADAVMEARDLELTKGIRKEKFEAEGNREMGIIAAPKQDLRRKFKKFKTQLQIECRRDVGLEAETQGRKIHTATEEVGEAVEPTTSALVAEKCDSEEANNARLIQECLTRRAEVRLERLTPHDIEQLRGFRVRVKRTNFGNYYRERTQMRKRKKLQIAESKSHSNTEDSNTSTPTSELKSNVRRRFKKFVHITSDTPAAALAMQLPKQRIRQVQHLNSDSSTTEDPDETARPASVKRRRGQEQSIEPRSASRPKVRFSKHASPKTRSSPNTADIIELSSGSSSSPASPVPSTSVSHFAQVAMPLELHPLYEEEIVPYF